MRDRKKKAAKARAMAAGELSGASYLYKATFALATTGALMCAAFVDFAPNFI